LCKAIGDANSYADFAREANAVSTGVNRAKIEGRGINGSGMDFAALIPQPFIPQPFTKDIRANWCDSCLTCRG
jgi:hypothetical protein